MHLQASDQASSDSASQEFPIYQQSHFNHRHKYMFQSLDSDNQTKYKKISPKTHNNYYFIPSSDTNPREEEIKTQQLNQKSYEEGERHSYHQEEIQRLKLLLKKQIDKNKEFQRQLFMRQKELLELKSKSKVVKKPVVNKVCIAPSNIKIQQIKVIQDELDHLKQQINKNSNTKHKIDELKSKNIKLKKQNKKYKAFVEAIAISLGIATEKSPPKGVNQTWKVWRQVFGRIAKDQPIVDAEGRN